MVTRLTVEMALVAVCFAGFVLGRGETLSDFYAEMTEIRVKAEANIEGYKSVTADLESVRKQMENVIRRRLQRYDYELPAWNQCFLIEQERTGCIHDETKNTPLEDCHDVLTAWCKARYGSE